jgi:hypothetical protein
MKLLFSALICTFFISTSLAQTLGMNEASVLLPLPESKDFSLQLSPTDQAGKGQLLPYSAFRLLPILTNNADQDTLYEHNLKVIGIRFDPCFAEGTKQSHCRKQIRLVWQPLIVVGNRTTTLDTAIHTFHEFQNSEWDQLLLEMKTFSNKVAGLHSGQALQVNPTLKSEGYAGTYWRNLHELILRYCGEQNLIRTTVMTVRQDRVWLFMGIDRTPSGWSMIKIPTLQNNPQPTTQSFFLMPEGLQNLEEFLGGVSVLPPTEDLWFRLLSDSKKMKETRTEPELKSVVRRAIQLENPRFHNPGTADCVSCHLAQTVRLWGENNFKKWTGKMNFLNTASRKPNKIFRINQSVRFKPIACALLVISEMIQLFLNE